MSLSILVERTRAVTTEGTAVPLFRLCFSRSVFASLGLVLANDRRARLGLKEVFIDS